MRHAGLLAGGHTSSGSVIFPFGRHVGDSFRVQGDKNIIEFEGDHNSARPRFYYDSISIFFINVLQPPDLPGAAVTDFVDDGQEDLSPEQVRTGASGHATSGETPDAFSLAAVMPQRACIAERAFNPERGLYAWLSEIL